MLYEYRLAGLCIVCELPFSLTLSAESREFFRPCADTRGADVLFSLHPTTHIATPTEAQRIGNRFYTSDCVYFCLHPDAPPFACVRRENGTPLTLRAEYLPEKASELRFSSNLCDLLSLETLLLLHGGFLLHASFVDIGGEALLFSAPSGTGKSTQAALWQTYKRAKIINGDRAALRCINGTWRVFGLPYAGSSQICHDADLPCRAIVTLRQAKENRLTRLSAREAVLALYPEMSVHEWETAQVEAAMGLLLQLLRDIPIYRLDCLPDEGAVRLLAKELSL